MEVTDYKCLSCNANMHFDPILQKWKCDYCGSQYALEDIEKAYGTDENLKNETEINLEQTSTLKSENEHIKNIKHERNENAKQMSNYTCYNCPNCGAEILHDETTTATFCVYCGSTAIIKNKLKGEFNPSKVIPFKTTKEQAIKAFESYKHGKLFMPDEFTNPNNIEKISGIYIPFFIYDCDLASNLAIDATRIKHWSTSSYNYTKTDFYNLIRDSKMHFENIPVDGSTKFPDDIMNSIEPFDYKDLKDFSPSYLSGFLSERFDQTMDELFEVATARAKKSAEKEVLSRVSTYATKVISKSNHNISKNNTSEYVLLPVWMLNVNFKGKMYTFAMNGQTGKFVGNIPVDKKKFWKWWRRLFFASLGITSLLVILFNLL